MKRFMVYICIFTTIIGLNAVFGDVLPIAEDVDGMMTSSVTWIVRRVAYIVAIVAAAIEVILWIVTKKFNVWMPLLILVSIIILILLPEVARDGMEEIERRTGVETQSGY
jgi:hypothetical protein